MGTGALSFAKLFLRLVTGAFIRGKARPAPLTTFPGQWSHGEPHGSTHHTEWSCLSLGEGPNYFQGYCFSAALQHLRCCQGSVAVQSPRNGNVFSCKVDAGGIKWAKMISRLLTEPLFLQSLWVPPWQPFNTDMELSNQDMHHFPDLPRQQWPKYYSGCLTSSPRGRVPSVWLFSC